MGLVYLDSFRNQEFKAGLAFLNLGPRTPAGEDPVPVQQYGCP